MSRFTELIRNSNIFINPPDDPNAFVKQLDIDISDALDCVAPLRKSTRRRSARPPAHWATEEARVARRECRRLERRFRHSGSEADRVSWRLAGRVAVKAMNSDRTMFFASKLNDAEIGSRNRWQVIHNLLHSTDCASNVDIPTVDVFCNYFVDKLQNIRNTILSQISSSSEPCVPPPLNPIPFTSFSPITLSFASSLLLSLSKSSPVDVIPASLLKSCNSVFSVLFMNLANRSLAAGIFPDALKTAQILPLLKKPTLSRQDPASYRPISNLRTLGKLLERVVQAQIRSHLTFSSGFSPMQSAYRPVFLN